MDWYRLDIDEIFQQLKSSPEGLTEEEAEERLRQYGLNKLAEEEPISKLQILFHQFTSPLIYILLIASVVTASFREYIDTGVILAVVILNAIIGYIQEYKAEESVRALQKLAVPKARVLREAKEKEIHSEMLVPGDIVLLASGAKVPADLRLFKTLELRVDEATLTGESVPSEKFTHVIEDEHLTPGDQENIAFMGTVVVNGRGRGIVVETGERAVLGQIADEVRELSVTQAPLLEKMGRFGKFIGLLTLSGAAAIFLLGLFMGMKASTLFMTAVAASVATIPEGLPIVVTITMAIGISQMAKRNAIIRKLPAVETLGSTTVICTDKTGTLTKNEMTVRAIYDAEAVYEVTGAGYEPKGEILNQEGLADAKGTEGLGMLLRIGMLCNESDIYEEEGRLKVDGDPTEGALIVSAMKAGLDPEEERERYPQIAIIPFESERGYMATLHQHGSRRLIFVKGAPEKVLDLCSECALKRQLQTEQILETAHRFAKEGMRVLAMAYKEASPHLDELTHPDVEGNLIWAGIQGMIDPPRPEAIEAVKGCKGAGIRVVMITGDYAATASAIGKMVGIGGNGGGVLTGREMEGMSDEDLFRKVKEVSVFARVSPHHKLRIVQQLMKHGEVVAVTGDGVNDAPALKAAHIGVAMGKTGTDVAKEAADMVIADDNFSSIFNAVQEGRVVFENIRKVILFLIPTGFAAILSILATMFLGMPVPYVPAQLLWINLVTNGLQDIALAFEPGEKEIIKRPPRNPKEGIMSRLMIQRGLLVGLITSIGVVYAFLHAIQNGDSLEQARTVAVTTMVFFQFFQAWNSRSEVRSIFRISPLSNPFLFYALIAAFLAHLAVLYLPPLQWVFRTAPLSAGEWLKIGGITATILIAVEIDKWLRRRGKMR